MRKQPLLVHIVFHPASQSARQLARHLHEQLNGDTMVPGLRVPTRFCPVVRGKLPPPRLPMESADRNCVVLLADDAMNIADEWCEFAAALWEESAPASVRLLPVQLSDDAWPLHPKLEKVSFAKAVLQPEGAARNAFVVRRVVVDLCRFLANQEPAGEKSPAPVKLFLSHAKADLLAEPRATESFIHALKADQPVEAWVDSGDIDAGSEFAKAIASGVQEASLLSILTDHYATREWCREEVFLAKENQRPVAVVNAMTTFEVRSFPYLGNVPWVRWDGDPQKGIDLLLKETLRHLHALALLQPFATDQDILFVRAPELATLVPLERGASVLYPDPPVGQGEATRLGRTGVNFSTPLERLAKQRALVGKSIALSMSESSDIEELGWDSLHVESSMLKLSRYLLIRGARLVYGGHLGKTGYTQQLFELVRMHNNMKSVPAAERILNLRGWPLPRLTVQEKSALKATATVDERGRPDDVDATLDEDFQTEPSSFSAEKSPCHRFAWARGMTEMRAFQADPQRSGVRARIVLGGACGPVVKTMEDGATKLQWYASRIPGVLEEIVLSVQAGQPVFLIGAFGGMAKLVIDLLQNPEQTPPAELTWDYQKQAPFAPEMKALYEQRGLPWLDYPAMIALLRARGIEGINPLLTREQHEQLFAAVDPMQMVELILEGLGKLG